MGGRAAFHLTLLISPYSSFQTEVTDKQKSKVIMHNLLRVRVMRMAVKIFQGHIYL